MRKMKAFYAGLFALSLAAAGMMGTSVVAEEYYYEENYDASDYYDEGSDYYYEEEVVLDGDNSLYSLGLNDAYSCTPDFVYNTLEYDVVVPAGTKEFDFSPVQSSSKAEIVSTTGTTLENGKGTVEVTVKAENGATVTYYLRVSSNEPEEEAVQETEKKKSKKKKKAAAEETAQETELSKVDKAALVAAESEKLALESEKAELEQKVAQLEQKEGQVNLLKGENDDLAYRLDLLMKVLYGLIAFAVLLLFFIINQSLRNKDLKDDIKKTKKSLEEKEATVPTSEFVYAPVQQQPIVAPVSEKAPAEEALVAERAQAEEPAAVSDEAAAKTPSKRQQKRAAKEAKKAAKAAQKASRAEAVAEVPVFVPMEEHAATPAPAEVPAKEATPAPGEPELVKGKVDEPDVTVDMIEL